VARTKKTLILRNALLQRVRIVFPENLTVPEALRAGLLLAGADLLVSTSLRDLARKELLDCGVDWEPIGPRRDRELPSGPANAARGPLNARSVEQVRARAL